MLPRFLGLSKDLNRVAPAPMEPLPPAAAPLAREATDRLPPDANNTASRELGRDENFRTRMMAIARRKSTVFHLISQLHDEDALLRSQMYMLPA